MTPKQAIACGGAILAFGVSVSPGFTQATHSTSVGGMGKVIASWVNNASWGAGSPVDFTVSGAQSMSTASVSERTALGDFRIASTWPR